jgi:hypothetical protein
MAKAENPALPTTWTASIFEEYSWPPPHLDPECPQQPFRLFMRIQRGAFQFLLKIHDARDPWLPPRWKSRARVFKFPVPPTLPVSTFLVYADGLRTSWLCRWLTVLLAQRSLLTREEEDAAIMVFFAGKADLGRAARLEAYQRVRRTFLQPTGGWLSFPALYKKAYKHIQAEHTSLLDGSYERESNFSQPDDADLCLEGIWDEISSESRRTKVRKNLPSRLPSQYQSLKQLRRQEPLLHRALLDRIRAGRVQTIEMDGGSFVTFEDASEVERQRQENAIRLATKRFPDKRVAWIGRLTSHGIKYKSAQRKLKRWINGLNLSEAEVEASVARGRVVRLRPAN